MNLQLCVAQAINSDLDIVEAFPAVKVMPIEEIEPNVSQYVLNINDQLCRAIRTGGESYLQTRDAAGLCSHLLSSEIALPLPMLRKMSETIVALYPMKVTLLNTARGPIYLVQMTI